MRGRPYTATAAAIIARNTPAYAGKTQEEHAPAPVDGKHPRVCGEDGIGFGYARAQMETPPRMRGRPAQGARCAAASGNTPAYAGKTISWSCGMLSKKKHPRVCGEDFGSFCAMNIFLETPPRMRGRLLQLADGGKEGGNTPAYAGKTVKKINLICQ